MDDSQRSTVKIITWTDYSPHPCTIFYREAVSMVRNSAMQPRVEKEKDTHIVRTIYWNSELQKRREKIYNLR